MGNLVLKSRHKLLCGDSTNAADVTKLMSGEKVQLCFTSPPYAQQREYTADSRDKIADWDSLMQGVCSNLPMLPDGQVLINLGLIHRDREWVPYWDNWIEWMRSQGWLRFGWYVWDKLNGAIGDSNGRLRSAHEWVFHFCKQPSDPQKTVPCIHAGETMAGDGQRKADGTLQKKTQAGMAIGSHKVQDSVIRTSYATGSSGHPAPFPVALPLRFIESWPGKVYEPFSGSGTTLIAAEQAGSRCFAMEIAPIYCDIAVKRFEKFTGERAVLWEP